MRRIRLKFEGQASEPFVIVETLQWLAIPYQWVNDSEYYPHHRLDHLRRQLNPARQISMEIPPPVTRSNRAFGDELLATVVVRKRPTA